MPLAVLGRAIKGAAKLGFRGLTTATLGGGGRRVMTGAAIGAAYGGLTSESNTDTGAFRSAVTGALAGAGLGALTTRGFWRGTGKVLGGLTGLNKLSMPAHMRGVMPHLSLREQAIVRGRQLKGALPGLVRSPLTRTGRGALSLGWSGAKMAGNFMLKHPVATGSIAATGLGWHLLTAEAGGTVGSHPIARGSVEAAQQVMASDQADRISFQSSTEGLVHGLHASRH